MKLIDLIDIQPQNIKWLYDLNTKGLLVVDNSFQRNYVWSKKNQIQLIESVIMGCPIPEIYIWNTGTDENTGDTKYSIVDGQQRTGAIFQYILNQYKLNDSVLNVDSDHFERIKNKFFRELDVEDKKAIWAYTFSIRLVGGNVERNNIVKMFLRLNSNNLTLNPQELRNAEFEGEFMEVVSTLSEREYWNTNKIFGIADRRRMRDISFISTLLVFMKQGIQEDVTEKNLNQIYDLYNNNYPDKDDDIKRFDELLNFIDIIIDGQEMRQKVIKRSVHLYSLFTALYELTLDDNQLVESHIENYRNFIDNYDSDESLKNIFSNIEDEILIYKALSQEGTRAQNNRLKRHNIIMKILNY
ncbi:DUF262 domain-containing protein [Acinetobacter terrestris]|uniref:DUF262 domain-containing protein n=1 Tax=Acinetobacter terrestris TaxID=2529843 RepID=A0AAW6ULJ8_9GAMM|nr:DUF262 domain-containing protein [Acinetobacter terrestris]MDK1682642.1 DUF262 domain-containing protein [Acinetobacter terrestris]